jgi:hypothetical protein
MYLRSSWYLTLTSTLICKQNIKIKLHSYSVKFIAVMKQVFVNLNRLFRNMHVRCDHTDRTENKSTLWSCWRRTHWVEVVAFWPYLVDCNIVQAVIEQIPGANRTSVVVSLLGPLNLSSEWCHRQYQSRTNLTNGSTVRAISKLNCNGGYWWILRVMEMLMELLVAAQFEPQPLHLLAQSSEWRHRPYQLHANLNTVSTVKAKQLINSNGGY